jgi:spore coat protein U-like protein
MKRWFGLLALILLLTPFAKANCTVSAVSINFGNYSGTQSTPGGTPITVSCPTGTAYNVGLDAGTGAGASTSVREMTGPASATLSYQMFQNPSRTINWGNTPGTDVASGTGTGSAQTINIYPQMAAEQNVAPGTYSDKVTVTVTYAGGTATTTLSVTATVFATCQLSTTSIDFGNYSGSLLAPGATPLTVTCTNTTSYDIGLDAGQASGATVTSRAMTGPNSATLNYQLFQDAAQTINWGNTVGIDTVHGTSNGNAQTLNIYPQILAGQTVPPGTYSDTIIVTATY